MMPKSLLPNLLAAVAMLSTACGGCTSKSPDDPGAGGSGMSAGGATGRGGSGGTSQPPPTGEGPTRSFSSPVALEPFRADGFTFAKPVGFARRDAAARTYLFESPDPAKTGIGRFQITHVGHLTWEQTPSPTEMVKQVLESRKLTPVDAPGYRPYYGVATADTGVAGPHRYVHIAVLQHCPLLDEDDPGKTNVSGGFQIFHLEFSAADLKTFETLRISHILRSIAWGISIPPDEIPAAALQGTWQFQGEKDGEVRASDSPDPWSGPDRITFRPGGNFEVLLNDGVVCGQEVGCIYEASTKALMTGRFLADGGVLVLSPSRCDQRDWNGDGKLLGTSDCDVFRMPVTLRMARADNSRIKFAGLGSVLSKTVVRTWYGRKRGGLPPGAGWGAPDPQMPPPGGTPGLGPCGQVGETEPNDTREQSTPYAIGAALTGCRATAYDDDYFEFQAPAGDGLGYLLGSVQPEIPTGEVEVTGEIVVPPGSYRTVINRFRSRTPGAAVAIAIPTFPGEKYRILVDSSLEGPAFKYTVRLEYKAVADAFPAGTRDQAKPLTLGTSIQSYFFYGLSAAKPDWVFDEWFTVDLQPGPASLSVDDVPMNVQVGVSVESPGNASFVYQAPFGEAGVARKASFTVTRAGSHTVRVRPLYNSGAKVLSVDNTPPANFTQPYRLLITQP